jgi:hypothetical protein
MRQTCRYPCACEFIRACIIYSDVGTIPRRMIDDMKETDPKGTRIYLILATR